jgi:hypothetical protein
MDERKTSLTVTSLEQGIFFRALSIPTELTFDFVTLLLRPYFNFMFFAESINFLNFSVHTSMVLSEN